MRSVAGTFLAGAAKAAVLVALAAGVYLSVRGAGVELPVSGVVGLGPAAKTLIVHAPVVPLAKRHAAVRPHSAPAAQKSSPVSHTRVAPAPIRSTRGGGQVPLTSSPRRSYRRGRYACVAHR